MTTKQAINVTPWTLPENMPMLRGYFGLLAYKTLHGKLPHRTQGPTLEAMLMEVNAVSTVTRGPRIDRKFQDVSAVLCAQGRPDLVCPGFKPVRDKETGELSMHVAIDEKKRIQEQDPMLWKLVAAHVLEYDAGIRHAVNVVQA